MRGLALATVGLFLAGLGGLPIPSAAWNGSYSSTDRCEVERDPAVGVLNTYGTGCAAMMTCPAPAGRSCTFMQVGMEVEVYGGYALGTYIVHMGPKESCGPISVDSTNVCRLSVTWWWTPSGTYKAAVCNMNDETLALYAKVTCLAHASWYT